MMCKKCGTLTAVLLLVLGLLYLLVDLGVWTFWGVSWYSALFLLVGVVSLGKASCPQCQACMAACSMSAKKSAKKKRR